MRSKKEETNEAQRCKAPVRGGCHEEYYAGGYCEGHLRRKTRAEENGRIPDLSTPVRKRSPDKTVPVSARISGTAHAFYLAQEAGSYAAMGEVLEKNATAQLVSMSPVERAEMMIKAATALAQKAKATNGPDEAERQERLVRRLKQAKTLAASAKKNNRRLPQWVAALLGLAEEGQPQQTQQR